MLTSPVLFFLTGLDDRNSFLNYGAGYQIAFAMGSIQPGAGGAAATGTKISAGCARPVFPRIVNDAASTVSTVPLLSQRTTTALLPFHTPPAVEGLVEYKVEPVVGASNRSG